VTDTVLQLCQDAAADLRIARPASFVGATDDETAVYLLRCLRKVLHVLSQQDWQALRREHTFTATGVQAMPAGALADDLLRFVAGTNDSPTFWNRTSRQPCIGPLSPGEWQSQVAQVAGSVVNSFYIRNGVILMNPVPSNGTEFYYEYITNQLFTNETETGRPEDDNDTPLFKSSEVIVEGMVLQHKVDEGLAYAEDMRAWSLAKYAAYANDDGPARVIDMAAEPGKRLPKPYPQDYTVT
jgi:hypothetical protein